MDNQTKIILANLVGVTVAGLVAFYWFYQGRRISPEMTSSQDGAEIIRQLLKYILKSFKQRFLIALIVAVGLIPPGIVK